MASIHGTSNQQQIYSVMHPRNIGLDRVGASPSATNQDAPVKESSGSKVETKGWSPIDSKSSLIPRTTEYGNTIGDVKLSDKAKDYYETLKAKYHNMDFIAVSKDMKGLVAQNAASYGNSSKMVVLIDEEKLERMATDESFRKKYEGIISMAQSKLTEIKNSLTSSGASLKNFGMSVDSDGKESFFATVEKSQELQKKRIEKKAGEKKEKKAEEKKKAAKEEKEERIRKAREQHADKADPVKKKEKSDETEEAGEADQKEYLTFEADSMEALLEQIRSYSFNDASARVKTDMERMLGTQVDYRG